MRYIGAMPGTIEQALAARPWYSNVLGSPDRFLVSNIPQGYSTLHGKAMLRSNENVNGDIVYAFLNADVTAANYVQGQHIFGASEANSNAANSNIINVPGGANGANLWATIEFWIERYTSTAHKKTIRTVGGENRNASGTAGLWGWQTIIYWHNTAAVTSLSIELDGYQASGHGFAAGSWMALWFLR